MSSIKIKILVINLLIIKYNSNNNNSKIIITIIIIVIAMYPIKLVLNLKYNNKYFLILLLTLQLIEICNIVLSKILLEMKT